MAIRLVVGGFIFFFIFILFLIGGQDAFSANYSGAYCPLDYAMDFSILCVGDALCAERDITPRLMYDESPNSQFNVVYELSDFWHQNDALKTECADSLNTSWWRSSHRGDEGVAVLADHERSHSVGGPMAPTVQTTGGVAVFLMIGAVAVVLLRCCASTMRKKHSVLDVNAGAAAYGAV